MQVANIPIKLAPQPSVQTSDQTEIPTADFRTALTDKLTEIEKSKGDVTTTDAKETKGEETAVTAEVIQILVTPAMQEIMQVFTQDGESKATKSVVAVSAEVSPNISAASAPPTENVFVQSAEVLPQTKPDQPLTEAKPTTSESVQQPPTTGSFEVKLDNSNADGEISFTIPDDAKSAEKPSEKPILAESKPTEVAKVTQKDVQQSQQPKEVNFVAKEVNPEPKETTEVVTKSAQNAETVEASKPVDTPEVKITETPKEKPTNGEVAKTDAKPQTNSGDSSEKDSNSNAKSEVEHVVIELSTKRNVVKISDSAANLDAKPIETAAEQVATSIKQNLSEGKTEYEMQLTPLNLGKITVKLTSQNGALTVEFVAENPKTQAMLTASASEIRELIQGTTGSTPQVITPNHNEGAPQNYTQQEQQNQREQQEQNKNQQTPKEQSENKETSTVDFLSILQQLKDQSRLTRI